MPISILCSFLSYFKIFLRINLSLCVFMCILCVHFACMYAWAPAMSGDWRAQKMVSEPLQLELWTVVNQHIGDGTRTWVLWRAASVLNWQSYLSLLLNCKVRVHWLLMICNYFPRVPWVIFSRVGCCLSKYKKIFIYLFSSFMCLIFYPRNHFIAQGHTFPPVSFEKPFWVARFVSSMPRHQICLFHIDFHSSSDQHNCSPFNVCMTLLGIFA